MVCKVPAMVLLLLICSSVLLHLLTLQNRKEERGGIVPGSTSEASVSCFLIFLTSIFVFLQILQPFPGRNKYHSMNINWLYLIFCHFRTLSEKVNMDLEYYVPLWNKTEIRLIYWGFTVFCTRGNAKKYKTGFFCIKEFSNLISSSRQVKSFRAIKN